MVIWWKPSPAWVHLPFKFPFVKETEAGNDINFNLDLSMRDDVQSNNRLDQANAYGTGGQKVTVIQPSIDMVLNNRVNLKLYFDQQRVNHTYLHRRRLPVQERVCRFVFPCTKSIKLSVKEFFVAGFYCQWHHRCVAHLCCKSLRGY